MNEFYEHFMCCLLLKLAINEENITTDNMIILAFLKKYFGSKLSQGKLWVLFEIYVLDILKKTQSKVEFSQQNFEVGDIK